MYQIKIMCRIRGFFSKRNIGDILGEYTFKNRDIAEIGYMLLHMNKHRIEMGTEIILFHKGKVVKSFSN